MITHQNLMSNQAQIQTAFGCDEQSVIFSWLPFHHDMGLIGNILHTIYVGCTGILMSPFHFIQRPGRWLEGIGKYKATHSGAPNFAYDLCVNKISPSEITSLDLFSWKVAFNGSEPIRADTIQQFSDYFKEAGFNENSFYPCYGMAEATLMVSGYKTGKPPLTIEVDKKLVSSGSIVPGMSVKILNGADLHECGELEAGEVYISGDNVTSGYWNKDNSSLFHQIDHQLFFPTGDLGFFYKNEIFIHGRLKEMLIIRGENIYPYDIEQMIAKRISVVEPNGVAVFSVNIPEEACVVVAEIKRTSLKDVDVFHTIRLIENEVIDSFGIVPHDILLINPLGIPRTTSGKIQRLKCNENYVQQVFNVIGSREKLTPSSLINNDALLSAVKDNGDVEAIRSYLIQVIESKTGSIKKTSLHEFTELTSMGIDSLRAMELVNTVNKDLHINIDVTKVFQDNTLSGLIKSIEDVLWLKNEQTSGGEIII
jgi:acyl-CoA synthetase (AMP-forming)/AMP-acid ligase II/acyl carrier protein